VLVPIPTLWARMVLIKHGSPKAMTTVRIGFEVLVYANVKRNPEMQGGSAGALWAKLCSVKQASREGPIDVWMRIGALNI
jgi:hypothetical protein